MKDYQLFIEDVLSEAADIALQYFGTVSGSVKGGDSNQVLTEADLAVGEYIVGRIKAEFPDHNIIDEEAGVIDNGSQFTWVVDPIDGTSNFASGSPQFGIMIGLLEGAQPVAGGIALPIFQEIYLAAKGKGTTCNGQPVTVTSETDLLNVLVAYNIDGHQEAPERTRAEAKLVGDIVLAIRNLRTSGSAVDIVLTANGAYGAVMTQTARIWDNVAPQIIIEEARGVYTDFQGKPMDYHDAVRRTDENFDYFAANPVLHEQLQRIIHEI